MIVCWERTTPAHAAPYFSSALGPESSGKNWNEICALVHPCPSCTRKHSTKQWGRITSLHLLAMPPNAAQGGDCLLFSRVQTGTGCLLAPWGNPEGTNIPQTEQIKITVCTMNHAGFGAWPTKTSNFWLIIPSCIWIRHWPIIPCGKLYASVIISNATGQLELSPVYKPYVNGGREE